MTSARAEWCRLIEPFGLTRPRQLETFNHIINAAYGEPHRHYHTIAHLEQCLDCVRSLIPYVANVDAIVLALFFHDIVYDPTATDNEQKSMERLLALAPRLQLPALLVDRAAHAVLATNHKALVLNDEVARYVVDVDLSVLGWWDENDYDVRYAWPVRGEYPFVSDKDFKSGRAIFLRALLDKPTGLYHTPLFKQRFEDRARENLRREIAILRREEVPHGTKEHSK